MTEKDKILLKELEKESIKAIIGRANSRKSEEKLEEEINFSD